MHALAILDGVVFALAVHRPPNMDSAIRRTLWGAYAVLSILVAIGLGLTITVLQVGKHQENRIVHGSEPLLDAVQRMDQDIVALIGAARGYVLTQQTQFLQQYDDAVRDFQKQSATAVQLASSPQDSQVVSQLHRQFSDLKGLADQQITLARDGHGANANEYMLEAA